MLDEVTGRRASGCLVLGLLGIPLGCAFLLGFVSLIVLFGGAFALIGLDRSTVVNLITLAAALVGAFALVVRVYRKMIARWPWLRIAH